MTVFVQTVQKYRLADNELGRSHTLSHRCVIEQAHGFEIYLKPIKVRCVRCQKLKVNKINVQKSLEFCKISGNFI